MITAELIVNGTIDPEKQIEKYIPELAGSAFADARVIEVLDMTAGIKYHEEYDSPEADVRKHLIAAGYLSPPPGYSAAKTLRTFLPTIKKGGETHHRAFHYVSANTEVLSWLVEKATELKGEKKTVNQLFHEKIWSKIGTEQDAYILKDSVGKPSWCGGFTATTRDMARVGQMILNRGRGENGQLLSPQTFEFMESRDLRAQYALSLYGSLPSTKGWSYANQFWWSHNEHQAFTGVGIHGQLLYIDPKANMVIAKNSSHPLAEDAWIYLDAVFAIHALAKLSRARPLVERSDKQRAGLKLRNSHSEIESDRSGNSSKSIGSIAGQGDEGNSGKGRQGDYSEEGIGF
jgi:hypothetical protein